MFVVLTSPASYCELAFTVATKMGYKLNDHVLMAHNEGCKHANIIANMWKLHKYNILELLLL